MLGSQIKDSNMSLFILLCLEWHIRGEDPTSNLPLFRFELLPLGLVSLSIVSSPLDSSDEVDIWTNLDSLSF